MPNQVLQVFDVDVVGVHYTDEHGKPATSLGIVEPNGSVHLFPDAISGTRLFVRSSKWLNEGVRALRGSWDPEQNEPNDPSAVELDDEGEGEILTDV